MVALLSTIQMVIQTDCRNIFYTFAISQITDPVVAAQLIENTAEYMMSGAIPVELTSFDANVTDAAVNLKWITATELNNSGFEIERKSY